MLASRLQVLQLPRLKDLSLVECGYSADSMGQLSRLASSLTRLDLYVEYVPLDTLAALTRLRRLHLCDCSYVGQELEAALPHLEQLTYLVSCRCCAWVVSGRRQVHVPSAQLH